MAPARPWQGKGWALLVAAFGVGCFGAFVVYNPSAWGVALAAVAGLSLFGGALRLRAAPPGPGRARGKGVFALRRLGGYLWYERRQVVGYVALPEIFALVVPRPEIDEDGSWNELIFLEGTRWQRWLWRRWLRTTRARLVTDADVEWHIARCMTLPTVAPADQTALQAPSPPL
jgi:hypothetical protein